MNVKRKKIKCFGRKYAYHLVDAYDYVKVPSNQGDDNKYLNIRTLFEIVRTRTRATQAEQTIQVLGDWKLFTKVQ